MVNKNLIKLKEILDKSNVDYDYNKILKDLKKDLKNKKYGLVWEDSKEKADKLLEENIPILKEEKALRIENTKKGPNHIIIEGDNLLGLKSLETSNKKVDVIYIDPPYNTGKEFTYNDKLVDKEDSYRHSKWLSFMNKRLKIARKVLADDGVIFISIDDNEQANLKLLMDEVFGEENFLANITWNKGYGKNNSKFFRNITEYILVYAKSKNKIKKDFITIKDGYLDIEKIVEKYKRKKETNVKELEAEIKKYYKENKNLKGIKSYNKVEDKTFRIYRGVTLESPAKGNYFYDVIHPKTGKPCKKPKKGWNRSKLSMSHLIKNNEVIWGKDHTTLPNRKYYLDEMKYEVPKTLINNYQQGGTEIREIMGSGVFDFPKPSSLLKHLIGLTNKPNAIVLDFFAGSGTTLQAVMELNKEDEGNRQCILVNTNEVSPTIIAKEANKRFNYDFTFNKAGFLYKNKENKKKLEKLIKSNLYYQNKSIFDNKGICRSITYNRSKIVTDKFNLSNLYYCKII